MHMRLAKLAALSALLTVAALSSACTQAAPQTEVPARPAASRPDTAPPASALASVEVTSFKGKPLDAVSAEPENSIKGPQRIDIRKYRLTVTGQVKTPLSLTYDQVLAMPAYQKVTTLNCVDGWSMTYLWQGVLLKDLLRKAGYDRNAKIVIFRCSDGYFTSLPLDYLVTNNILLADRMNGLRMPPERGFPFQVVAENQVGYKWAKWITGIEVSSDTRFRGYYERMGYSNSEIPSADK